MYLFISICAYLHYNDYIPIIIVTYTNIKAENLQSPPN